AGAWAVRVHEVRATADAVRVARAVEEAHARTGTADSTTPAPGTHDAEGAR
ncbi:dihydropteroate synthase, partial [Streptomyces sp. SID7804]|nr:dihydropteroate synthase [Streptomyces sp. SID7804]